MHGKNIFYAGVVGFVVLSAILFRFSFLNENGVSSREIKRKQQLPAQNDINIMGSSDEAVKPMSIDYPKILEKYKGQDVERISTDKKIMALTFDGGGNADGVDEILGILSENSIRSTFFLTGKFIEKFPEAVGKIKESGHEIANHTYSHKNLAELSGDEAAEEVSQMKAAAEKSGVVLASFSRFPYGAYKKENIALVNSLGYASVRWTVDSLGWQGRRDDRDANFVAERVAGKAVPGAIVLMHLGSASDGSALDADALPDIIKTLGTQGYQFVTLSKLFSQSLQN